MVNRRFPKVTKIYQSILVEALSDCKNKWEGVIEKFTNGSAKVEPDAIKYMEKRVKILNEMVAHYGELEEIDRFKFLIAAITALSTFSYISYNYIQNNAINSNFYSLVIVIISSMIIAILPTIIVNCIENN